MKLVLMQQLLDLMHHSKEHSLTSGSLILIATQIHLSHQIKSTVRMRKRRKISMRREYFSQRKGPLSHQSLQHPEVWAHSALCLQIVFLKGQLTTIKKLRARSKITSEHDSGLICYEAHSQHSGESEEDKKPSTLDWMTYPSISFLRRRALRSLKFVYVNFIDNLLQLL